MEKGGVLNTHKVSPKLAHGLYIEEQQNEKDERKADRPFLGRGDKILYIFQLSNIKNKRI